MARKSVNIFGLAFLDVMFCGFGAVILLVMIISSKTVAYRDQINQDLISELDTLEQEVLDGRKNLVRLKNSLEQSERELVKTQGLSKFIVSAIRDKEKNIYELERNTIARTEEITRLQSELKSLEKTSQRMETEDVRGDKVRTFVGQGNRQYLTGLKVGGKRIFILVDSSASMLDTTIVNIIRQRNLPKIQRIRSAKWQRVVSTVDWLTSQIPPSSLFQIYSFNESSQPLLPESKSKWLPAKGGNYLNKAFSELKRIVPEKGTSLYNAFASLKSMRPRPDNVFLLTDGLPTQGKTKSGRGKVSGKQRLNYFRAALKQLPPGIPVNTILFPIEGDPQASSSFWKLAIRTKGSLLSPSKDWP